MKRSCSCPDDGDPCKHMAALYYSIAREIDSDPTYCSTCGVWIWRPVTVKGGIIR